MIGGGGCKSRGSSILANLVAKTLVCLIIYITQTFLVYKNSIYNYREAPSSPVTFNMKGI